MILIILLYVTNVVLPVVAGVRCFEMQLCLNKKRLINKDLLLLLLLTGIFSLEYVCKLTVGSVSAHVGKSDW